MTSAKESNEEQWLTNSLSRIVILCITKSCQILWDDAYYTIALTISVLFSVSLWKLDIFGAHQTWHFNLPVAVSHVLPIATLMIFVLVFIHRGRRNSVYLLDISCFRAADILRVPHASYLEHAKLANRFNEESLIFQKRMLEKCCLGEQTSFPLCFRYLPPKPSMSAAREEAETVMFTCLDNLLRKTRVKAKDIGIVVVNCSSYNPSPSLCAMIVNRYRLSSNVKTYNLGGMGCSAGVVSIDVAKHALLATRNTYAVVLSTENISQNMYWGNNRSMLLSNCLFRVGGSAILLSNKPVDKTRAKYHLRHIIRTHMGADDAGYYSAYQVQDDEGNVGVSLSKELMRLATETLKMNLMTLGPLVLPYFEQLRFILNLMWRKIFKKNNITYVPNFKTAFEHFCIHSGARSVISAVEKNLNLSSLDVEPAIMTLYRFGNTSSSTTWYQFQYLEAKGRIRKGDRICQVAFGAGFKCNSAVWTALRTISRVDSSNAWSDCIMDYPVSTTAHIDS